eukprot:PhM_4_TR1117/c0_g1_i1/m.25725/K06210/NMNAT; nicotinamide mononucleotide adenylyltransferase
MSTSNQPSWDFSVVESALLHHELISSSDELTVLLTTGAMNPPHRGHVEMLERTARSIATNVPSVRVIAGFVSPSHMKYVQPKSQRLRTIYFPSEARVDLCSRMLAEHQLLRCGTWESHSSHNHWPDFPVVARSLLESLRAAFPQCADRLTVTYVCGADHFERCGLGAGMGTPGVNVAAVAREGCKINIPRRRPTTTNKNRVFTVDEVNPEVSSLSSTSLRAVLKKCRVVGVEPEVDEALAQFVPTDIVPLLKEWYLKAANGSE